MQNGQMTVFDIFDGTKIFTIPKYQRAYAWNERQLKDFVDDLENQKDGKAYFLGTILFQVQQDDGFFKRIDIVDGQQRITTVIIFMKLLLDKLAKYGQDTTLLRETYLQRHGEYKLRVLDQDNDFFRSYILQDHPVNDDLITTPSQHRLLAAKAYLKKLLEPFSLSELQTFQEKLRHTRVLSYAVDNTADATLIFETTNDRGKGLTNLEKTKSFLMYKAYLCHEHPDSHLDLIQGRFSQIYSDYEVIRDRVDEDTILQYHFIAFERWHSTREERGYYKYVQQIKEKVNKLIAQEKRQEAGEYIDQYTRELRESFACMKSLLLNGEEYLTNLFAVGRPAIFYPLLIKAWKYDQSADKRAFCKVVRLAEIHAFKAIGVKRMRSDTGREYLYALARDFRGNFDSLLSAFKQKIGEYCSQEEFEHRLMQPYFYRTVYNNDIRYLLWQYENHLRREYHPKAMSMSYAAFANQDSKTKLSIEHIAAQNPKQNVVVDATILPEITKEFEELYLHCLGNLTFDPLSANASKSNNNVDIKILKYFSKAPFKTQNELEDFLHDGKWDAESVKKRRNKIVDFALRYWDQERV